MVRLLTEINPVLGPVQPCTIRNLQPNSVSHECVYIWKYGLSMCSCESSRKDLQSKQGRRVLSKEEHGLFCDAVQRLGLPNEVKQAAVALYLDFKCRPIGEYNAEHKNLEIFLIATVSLAEKAMGDLRTDHEFESKMFVSKEKLADAEERILRSFGVQDSIMRFPDLVSQLTKRQIESMAQSFAERELVSNNEREELVRRSN